MNNNVQVAARTAHAATPMTKQANRMLVDAGRALQLAAAENTARARREFELTEKLSAAQRKEELFQIGLTLAERNEMKISSVRAQVDRWFEEGRDPSYYRDLHNTRMNLQFGAPASTPVVDKASSARQDGSHGSSDVDRFDYNELDRFYTEHQG